MVNVGIDNGREYDFTVIVPCHNSAAFIMPLLHTFAMQNVTGLKMQYVFVFDRCDDGTSVLVRDNSDMIEWDKIEFIECDHGRAGLARNEGLDVAQGRWIVFADSDDTLVHPEFFQVIARAFEDGGPDVVTFDFLSNGRIYGPKDNGGGPFPACWSRAYTRSLIGDTRFNEKKIGEDLDFAQELFNGKNKMAKYEHEVLYRYDSRRIGSLSHEGKCVLL